MALSKIDLANMVENQMPQSLIADNINFRNIIINGDMSIAQRSTSVSSITSSSTYKTIDRFVTELGSNGTWTQSQSTDVPTGQGFGKSLKMDCTSTGSGGYLHITQRFEGQNLVYLNKGRSTAESLTLSFWVKSAKTGTYIAEFRDTDNTRNISKSYTISSADTWEKKTITYPGDTSGGLSNDNGASLELNLWLAAGSSNTSGTLQTDWGSQVSANRAVGQVNLGDSTSNEWYITGLQLEAGTAASDFEFLPHDVNKNRCLRYYQKSYSLGTTPGTNTTNGLHTTDGSAGGLTTGYLYGDIDLKVAMRAAPTVTLYDKAGNSGVCARLNGGVARTDSQNCSAGDIIEKSFSLESTGTANAGSIDVHFEAEAELWLIQ